MKSRKTDKKVWLSVVAGLAFVILTTNPRTALAQQWTTNGNNISNTNTGNVGIGTTNPASRLHIISPGEYGLRIDAGSAGTTRLEFYTSYSSPNTRNWAIRTDWQVYGDFGIYQSNSRLGDPMALSRFYIKNNGDVGIGTTAPSGNLHVYGNNYSYFSSNVDPVFGGSLANVQGLAIGWNRSGANGETNLIYNTSIGSAPRLALGSYNGTVYTEEMTVRGGSVGIGTTSPSYALDVQANAQWAARFKKTDATHGGIIVDAAAGYNPNLALSVNGTIKWYMNNNTGNGDTLQFWESSGATPRFTLTQAGSVGIGTAGPGYRLDVQGGQINSSGGLCIAGDCKTAWSQVGGGTSQWITSGSSVYYNTGNVGIGATSPAQLLHVQKDQDLDTNILVENDTAGTSAQADLRVKNNSGALGQLGIYSSAHSAYGALAAGDVHVYSTTNLDLMVDNGSGVIKFATGGNAEKVRIDASGNVGIGTSSPTTKLHVVGDGKVTGNLTVDGNIAAKYQDVAEWVPASQHIPAGTVVALDPNKSNQVVQSAQAYDTRVAGVISQQPGIALGESGSNKVLVATTGRVKVKVDATRSPIHIGDLLVTSDITGMAMKSEPVTIGGVQIHQPGTLIGKALEPLAKGQGEILVLLSLQ